MNDFESGLPMMDPSTNPLRSIEMHRTIGSDSDSVEHWSSDVEHVLADVRSNAEILSEHHKEAYLHLQSLLVYFRVPLIILSAVNSVFSVGLSVYIDQESVSTINCLISLVCACISSVELFLQIQKKLEVELASYHGYYLLGTKISATLKLSRDHREIEGISFLNTVISEYNNLFEQSCVNRKSIDDQLVKITPTPPKKQRPLLLSPFR